MRLISSLKRSDYSTLALFTNLVFLLSIIDNSYQLFPSNHDSIKGNYVRSNTIPVDDPPRNNNESFTYRINNSNSSALIANNDSDREARRSGLIFDNILRFISKTCEIFTHCLLFQLYQQEYSV